MTQGEGEGEWNVIITIIREMVQLTGASDTGLGMQACSYGHRRWPPRDTSTRWGDDPALRTGGL